MPGGRVEDDLLTTAESGVPPIPEGVHPDLQREIEAFLYFEAQLLDDRRFQEWYALFANDLHYWMPTRTNRLRRELVRENSAPGEMALFDDDKQTLGWRVYQLETGMHWAEDPPSRTRHLVTNVRASACGDNEYAVRSNFLCYRNRLEDEVDIWAGERDDLLRHVGPRRWQIARRSIYLDQNVVLSKNLSVFF